MVFTIFAMVGVEGQQINLTLNCLPDTTILNKSFFPPYFPIFRGRLHLSSCFVTSFCSVLSSMSPVVTATVSMSFEQQPCQTRSKLIQLLHFTHSVFCVECSSLLMLSFKNCCFMINTCQHNLRWNILLRTSLQIFALFRGESSWFSFLKSVTINSWSKRVHYRSQS